MQIGFILSLIFAIIVAVFALQNSEKVLVDFLFFEIKVSQALIIFISAALGAAVATIQGIIRQIKYSVKLKESNKRINVLEDTKIQLEKRIEELINNNKLEDINDFKIEKNKNEDIKIDKNMNIE